MAIIMAIISSILVLLIVLYAFIHAPCPMPHAYSVLIIVSELKHEFEGVCLYGKPHRFYDEKVFLYGKIHSFLVVIGFVRGRLEIS